MTNKELQEILKCHPDDFIIDFKDYYTETEVERIEVNEHRKTITLDDEEEG